MTLPFPIKKLQSSQHLSISDNYTTSKLQFCKGPSAWYFPFQHHRNVCNCQNCRWPSIGPSRWSRDWSLLWGEAEEAGWPQKEVASGNYCCGHCRETACPSFLLAFATPHSTFLSGWELTESKVLVSHLQHDTSFSHFIASPHMKLFFFS